MRQHSRRLFAAVAAALILLVAFASTGTSGQPTQGPRLVLVVVIDQMRFDYLTRFDPLYTGGLRMLLDRGAVFTNAKYRHAASETGPGHSVVLTGRHPSHSGIVANDWYDPHLRRPLNVVDDPVQKPVGGAGRGASPINAIGFTLGDVLKANDPASKVIGVSLKDRTAILLSGRRADAAYWYESVANGHFITSTYYMSDVPAWLARWNARNRAAAYAGKMWTRLLPDDSKYERYAGVDAVEGEWDRKDTVFPHKIRGNPPDRLFYDDVRRTPFADELTLEVALEAMKAHRLGEDDSPDVMAVGFSATDVIGHTYGPDSHEMMDQNLRLDRLLDRLFKEIDSRVGMNDTLVVLTSDHGVAPLVEHLQAQGLDAKRSTPATLEAAVKTAFSKQFSAADGLIAYFTTPDFFLNETVIREKHLNRRDVEQTAIAALLSTGLVAQVYTHDDLRSGSSSDPLLPLFQNGFFEPRSPHLTVLLKEHVYLSPMLGGTGHGTVYDRDRHVPIVFMGSGVTAGRYDDASGPEDIAPTLARMLGIELPLEPDARLLNEMLSVPAPRD